MLVGSIHSSCCKHAGHAPPAAEAEPFPPVGFLPQPIRFILFRIDDEFYCRNWDGRIVVKLPLRNRDATTHVFLHRDINEFQRPMRSHKKASLASARAWLALSDAPCNKRSTGATA